jgi:hypothetical protein
MMNGASAPTLVMVTGDHYRHTYEAYFLLCDEAVIPFCCKTQKAESHLRRICCP